MLSLDSVKFLYKESIVDGGNTSINSGANYKPAFIERALSLYESSGSLRHVYDKMGVCRNTVILWAEKYTIGNVEHERTKAKNRTISSLRVNRVTRRGKIIVMLEDSVMGTKEISKELNVSLQTLRIDIRAMLLNGELTDVSIRKDVILVRAA